MTRVFNFNDGFTSSATPTDLSGGAEVVATQSITASGTITLDSAKNQLLQVQGDGAAVSTSITPFGTTPPSNGTEITVMGMHATNTVKLTYNDNDNGILMNGPSIELGFRDTVNFIFVTAQNRYVETGRNH